MSARIHFQSWPEPHVFDGSDLTVPCGAVLARAKAVVMLDSWLCSGTGVIRETSEGCRKCRAASADQRYYYAVVSGEESRQMEAKRG